MRNEMERMEEEREQMVAEVEAQIERALASMMIGDDDDDEGYRSFSRPISPRLPVAFPLRSRSAPGSRRPSFTQAFNRPPRDSFATDTTAAEPMPSIHDRLAAADGVAIEEEEEESDAVPKIKAKANAAPQPQEDEMDSGITEKSDRIAKKVLQIKQKERSMFTLGD